MAEYLRDTAMTIKRTISRETPSAVIARYRSAGLFKEPSASDFTFKIGDDLDNGQRSLSETDRQCCTSGARDTIYRVHQRFVRRRVPPADLGRDEFADTAEAFPGALTNDAFERIALICESSSPIRASL